MGFNKNFIRFMSGFMGIVALALFVVFVAGYYETEIMGNKGEETATTRGSGAIGLYGKSNIQNKVIPRQARSLNWQPEYPPRPE